jgi:hypothetical protein
VAAHQQHHERLVPISAKVPRRVADEVSGLADLGDRSLSREIRRAVEAHVDSGGRSLVARPEPAERGDVSEARRASSPPLAVNEER